MTDTDASLLERVRAALASEPTPREQPMFGGVSFMVDDKIVVTVGKDASLLARVDPATGDDLCREAGVEIATMGQRSMGSGWLRVDADALTSDAALQRWVTLSLAYIRQA